MVALKEWAVSYERGTHLQVPVLRNRKRALIFFESPFDTFGPSSGDDPAAAER